MEPPASVKSPQPVVLDCTFLASRYFRPYSSILFLLRRQSSRRLPTKARQEPAVGPGVSRKDI
jgi:hypothetical protein